MASRRVRAVGVVLGLLVPALGVLVVHAILRDRARARAGEPDLVTSFDVGARAHAMASGFQRGKPHKEIYYDGPGGTAHLHLIMPGQTVPLHIHERSVEATVPVMGSADVTQRFASGQSIDTRKGRYDEGTLVVSPRDCAHEWVNPLARDYHASLVFTLGHGFTFNLFVGPDDPRILASSPPTILDPGQTFDEFVASPDRVRRVEVPVAQGKLAAVFLKDTLPVEPDADHVSLVYVVRGSGRLDGTSVRVSLTPTVLAVLRRAPTARVVADPPGALAFYLVGIPRKQVEPAAP